MRRRHILVNAAAVESSPGMEMVLLRCPKFYARENLQTVFPDAERWMTSLRTCHDSDADTEASYYILYTFQEADYIPDTSISDLGDHANCSAGVPTSENAGATSPTIREQRGGGDPFSELIQSSPSAVEFKDRSRDRFFSFMKIVQRALQEELGSFKDDVPAFFMDWSDPATGLPMQSGRGATIFCDADAIQHFFSFSSVLIAGPGGGCRMIEHPRYGLSVYPAAGIIAVPRSLENALCAVVRSFAK